MMPVIAWNALHATRILTNAMRVLHERCVAGIRADEERCRELLDRSTALATALSPYIGYAATADIAKTSVETGRSIRELVRERKLLPDEQLDAILSAEAMTITRRARAGGHRLETPSAPGEHDETPSTAVALCLILAGAASQRRRNSTRACSGRRIWGSSSRRIATSGSSPDRIMDVLGVGDGSVVADLGAGSGWFTIRLAERVGPNGMVFAEDVQRQMIRRSHVGSRGSACKNVRTVLGTQSDPQPPETCRRRPDRRRVPRDGAAGRAAPQHREVS